MVLIRIDSAVIILNSNFHGFFSHSFENKFFFSLKNYQIDNINDWNHSKWPQLLKCQASKKTERKTKTTRKDGKVSVKFIRIFQFQIRDASRSTALTTISRGGSCFLYPLFAILTSLSLFQNKCQKGCQKSENDMSSSNW